ncbi:MAG TPA: hypothetical protein VL996_03310 [Methylocella sp.]|nr:hypothetical protein [Methylocella sp.]
MGLEVIINDNCYQQRSEADDQNKPRAKTRDDLVAATASILKSIQKRPDRVKSYFHAKQVRYAA